MKLFSWLKALFSHQKNHSDTNQKSNFLQPYDPRDWKDLAEYFAPHDNRLSEEVVLAITNPTEYDRQFPDRLNNRGMKSIEEEPILSLIDGLLGRDLAMSLDWKASMEEFHMEALKVMTVRIQDTQWLHSLLDSPSEAFAEHFELIKKTFNEAGYTIIGLDNNSDEYNLTIVALTDFDDTQAKLTKAKCKFFTLDEMILES